MKVPPAPTRKTNKRPFSRAPIEANFNFSAAMFQFLFQFITYMQTEFIQYSEIIKYLFITCRVSFIFSISFHWNCKLRRRRKMQLIVYRDIAWLCEQAIVERSETISIFTKSPLNSTKAFLPSHHIDEPFLLADSELLELSDNARGTFFVWRKLLLFWAQQIRRRGEWIEGYSHVFH